MFNAKKPQRKPLSELEHQVMQVLWSLGPSSSEQVRDALAPTRPLKDSTIRTLLRRLHAKGYVTHEVTGRTFIYRGAEAPQNVAAKAVRQIIDRFCDGSLEQLLVGMVENKVVGRAELQELARKIARQTRKGE
jgi:BlaI family transcriptional regulator, penicillinase repressor